MSRRVGIFSGTFDPFHSGHRALVEATLSDVDTLLVIPEARPWRKEVTTSLADRVAMAQLALEGLKGVAVLEVPELDQHNIRVFKAWFEKSYPASEMVLIMGGDVFANLPKWEAVDQLLALKPGFIVGLRTEDDGEEALEVRAQLKIEAKLVVTDAATVSGSAIRQQFVAGKEPTAVTESVRNYIHEQGLYQP